MNARRPDTQQHRPEWLDGADYPEAHALARRCKGAWAIHRDVARALYRLTVQERRVRVLEFGAGTSSLVFAHAMARGGGGMLTSVEQNPEWCRDLWAEVRAIPSVDARLIVSGVRAWFDANGPHFRYSVSPDVLRERAPFDLAFIDAPQGSQFGRDGSLHWCFEYLAPGAYVVLDDARRPRERRTVRRWLRAYPGLELMVERLDFGRGLTVLRHTGGGRRISLGAVAGNAYDFLRLMGGRAKGRLNGWSDSRRGALINQGPTA